MTDDLDRAALARMWPLARWVRPWILWMLESETDYAYTLSYRGEHWTGIYLAGSAPGVQVPLINGAWTICYPLKPETAERDRVRRLTRTHLAARLCNEASGEFVVRTLHEELPAAREASVALAAEFTVPRPCVMRRACPHHPYSSPTYPMCPCPDECTCRSLLGACRG